MSDVLNSIKPSVRAVKAYTLAPHRASLKLNQNENPWDAPARIKDEVLRRFAERRWSQYPDFVPARLNERLAAFADWRSDGIIAGNGSNELIQALLMVTMEPGKTLLLSEPTFTLYRQVATVLGGKVETVPLTAELSYDNEALRRFIEEKQPDVTIICSPNNPTGCVIDDDALRALLKASHGLVIIDEAYHEFAGRSVVPYRAADVLKGNGRRRIAHRLPARIACARARDWQSSVAIQRECVFANRCRSRDGKLRQGAAPARQRDRLGARPSVCGNI